jgi:hypothetical protein
MVKWVVIAIVILGGIGIAYEIWNQNSSVDLSNYTNRDSVVIETNAWEPYLNIPEGDTESIFEVTWDQKYGATKTSFCMIVFRNEQAKQYKLVAPWLDGVIIEYQNTNDIKFNKVLRKDAPNYKNSK